MTNITIKNLEYSNELDREAMADVKGGVIQWLAGAAFAWGAGKLLDSLDDNSGDWNEHVNKLSTEGYGYWYR